MLYRKNTNPFVMHPYVYYAKLIISSVMLIFVLGSLYSYNTHDMTPWFYSTATTIRHNIFGYVGSTYAALSFYLFGGAGFIIVGMLLFYIWLTIKKKTAVSELDRFGALVLALVSLATLARLYNYDLIANHTPGGVLGLRTATLLIRVFDKQGAFVCASILLSIALILFFHNYLHHIWHATIWCARCIGSKEKLWQPLYAHCRSFSHTVIHALRRSTLYVYRVLSGTIVTDHYYELTQDDFEDIFSETEENSAFWRHYQVSDKVLHRKPLVEKQEDHVVEQEQEQELAEQYRPAQPEPNQEMVMRNAQKTTPSAPKAQKQDQGIFATRKQPYALPNAAIFIGRKEEQDDPSLIKELEKQAIVLKDKLERFGVYGAVTAIKRGPVVTVFEYQPDIDSKISKIIALEDDLALALQALSIRIIAPIPGRSVVGFEVANTSFKKVSFAKIITSPAYQKFSGALPLLLGEDTNGADVVVDLARMPHLLIAGSTGSGKSVALNGMLTSLLCRLSPDELRLILIDPKRLEFAPYADIAHLIFPIITDPKKAAPVLRYVVKEMEERYELMAQVNARNIFDYHAIKGSITAMPFMVVVIDELADLMMTAGKDIELLITRIAQMARAAGIHMMVATQRPSVDVITGLIKVNFPSRISFRVTSKIDSRTILDAAGADKLLGRGDMLFLDSSAATIKRVHGAFVSDEEIAKVVDHIRCQRVVSYAEIPSESMQGSALLDDADDQLYQDVLSFLQTIDEISISLLQRKFRIGFNRSARIIDMLEAQGLILPGHGGKTRKVIR